MTVIVVIFFCAALGAAFARALPLVIQFAAGLAPLALAFALFAIPVNEALAHNDNSATLHAETYPLHEAAKVGDLDSVNHFITVHMADVNAKSNYYGETPLHRAAQRSDASFVSILIAAGADVNVKSNSGNTPLHYAAQRSHASVVSILIAAGADVDAKNNSGNTPLHYAAQRSHASVVSILIAAGADVDAKNNSGNTPLRYAARYVHASVASILTSILIAAGADVNVKNNSGNTPLHYAAQRSHASVVSILIAAGADVDAKNNSGNTPLHYAAQYGYASVASILIAAGADVNAKSNGETPLHYAARYGRASVVSILIAAGADVSAKGSGDYTPLHYAAQYGHASVASILIAAGADVNAKSNGETPLHYAARYGRASVVSILIAAGGHWGEACAGAATVNPAGASTPCLCESPNMGTVDNCVRPSAESCGGLTPPMHYDATAGECVEFKRCRSGATLNRGENICECASPSVLDGTGLGCEFTFESCAAATLHYNGTNCEPLADCATPSTRNQSTNQCECHSPNLGTGGDCQAPSAENCAEFYNPPRFYDASAGECGDRLYPCHDSAIRRADNSGCECPPNSYAHGDPSGGSHSHIPDTAICHANHAPISHDLNGWLDSIQTDNPTLILHFISDHNESPNQLAHAIQHSAHRAITILINRGANLNLADSDGDTPLHLAARRADTPENAALVSFLLDKGANPNIFNDRRWRPLDLADGRDGYPRRRKIMSALIAGGANWSDECVGGKVPNEFTPPKCKCPARLSIDNNGLCECPGHSHSQVNGLCLPKDSAQVEGEIAKMQVELARLRAALVSLNARLSLSAEMPRETVEDIAEQARETAAEIDWRRANFVALGRRAEAGEAPPPVALSDTAAECRMRGGEVRIDSASGTRICLGLDRSGTFCLVDSDDAFPCRGLFKHVRRCNDVYHRPALNAFICGARCDVDETARGRGCE